MAAPFAYSFNIFYIYQAFILLFHKSPHPPSPFSLFLSTCLSSLSVIPSRFPNFHTDTVVPSSDHCRTEAVCQPSDHYCIETVMPSGDHYYIDIVVPSSDHCCTETVLPSSDHCGTTKAAPDPPPPTQISTLKC